MTDLWRWIGRYFIYLALTMLFVVLLNITLKSVAGFGIGQIGGVIITLVPAFLTGMQFTKGEGREMRRDEKLRFSLFVVALQLVFGLLIAIQAGLVTAQLMASGPGLLALAVIYVVYTGVAMIFLHLGGKDGLKK